MPVNIALDIYQTIFLFFSKDSTNNSLSPVRKASNFYLLHAVLKCICLLDKKKWYGFFFPSSKHMVIGHLLPDFHTCIFKFLKLDLGSRSILHQDILLYSFHTKLWKKGKLWLSSSILVTRCIMACFTVY